MFGLQFTAFVLAQILLQTPIGRATDVFGRKPFIAGGMALLVPTTLAQGLILDSWLLFGARFAQGVAGAMVFAPALAPAGDLAPTGRSGSTLSVLTIAFGFGTALAVVGLLLVWTQVEETITTR